MKNGNATFCGRLHLCVLLLAILPSLNAETRYFTGSNGWQIKADFVGNDVSGGTVTLTPWSGNGGVPAFSWEILGGTPSSGTWTAGDSSSHTVSTLPGTAFYSFGQVRDLTATVNGETYVWGSGSAGNVSLTLRLALRNNTNRAQTVSVSAGGGTQTLAPLASTTLTFTPAGAPGGGVGVTVGPDSVTWDSNYDPIVIPYATGQTIDRAGAVGRPKVTQHIHGVFTSFSTSPVALTALLDGTSVGTVAIPASADGVTPKVTSYDWNLSFSPDSVFSFSVPSGHSIQLNFAYNGQVTTIKGVIDSGGSGQASVSTGQPSSDGTTTVVTTDPTTGTTSITHSVPQTPSNTNTDPSVVFGGNSTPATVTGGTYANTTAAAGSAAAQDSASSLASIAANTKVVADHVTDVQKRASEKNLDGLVLDYTNDASAKAAAAISDLQEKANQVKTAASGAHAAKFGSPGPGPNSPSNPNPASVELNIGGGMTRTMLLNPFAADGPIGGIIAKAAALIKRLIAYAIVMFFLREVLKEVRGVVGTAFLTGGYTSQTVDMISKVNVFGNSAGVPAAIALRVLMISVIITLVLTLPLAVYAAVESGLPWSDLIDVYRGGAQAAAATGGDSALEKAIGWADYVIPWRLMLSTPLYYILIHNVLFPLQVFWQVVFKFLP